MADSNFVAQSSKNSASPLPHLADLGEGQPDFVPLRLVMEPGGLALELKYSDLVVGRHSGADLRLPLPDVSRRHCRLVFLSGRWHVQDLKSLNGIYVNDELMSEAVLQNGDRLRIGGFIFNVELPDGAEGSESLLRRLIQDLPEKRTSSPFPQRKAS